MSLREFTMSKGTQQDSDARADADTQTEGPPRLPQGPHILATLFWNALVFSLTASNGYAILASMKDRYVRREHWLDEEQMSDYIALAQSTPGPLAVSGAYIVGHRIAGVAGALVSVLGIVIPPVVTMTAVYYAYDFFATNPYIRRMFLGMQAAVCAFIVSITIDDIRDITKRDGRGFLLLVFAASFLALKVFGLSVLATMIAAAIGSIAYFRLRSYRGKGKKDAAAPSAASAGPSPDTSHIPGDQEDTDA